ncbi:MAG TPA: LacI family DNA-binding transcriptional regulator [Polyangiaceae bacterium]|nr:LacI family DNA-binding transcriptional regulator [Polyangiaceae bacterium]
MTRRADIAEVARHARVSKSTVSRVINGGYASPEVRARVTKVIQKLAYTPWTTARNFSLGRAGCVGFVIEDTQGQWIAQILAGIEAELTSKHISLLVGSLVIREHYDATTVTSWVRERRVDGLVFARCGRHERAMIDAARRSGIAVALISPDDDFTGVDVLRSDNVGAGRAVGQYLFDLGHRRIAFVGGQARVNATTFHQSVDSRHRLDGLSQVLAEHGVKIPESSIVFLRYHVDSGVEYARRWLKMTRSRAPTVVVFGNDAMALGFMRTVQSQGVRIPDEVSVVGFDDIPSASLLWPGLTTVRQEMSKMGETACQLVRRALERKSPGGSVHQFPVSLVVRESTGRAPAGE